LFALSSSQIYHRRLIQGCSRSSFDAVGSARAALRMIGNVRAIRLAGLILAAQYSLAQPLTLLHQRKQPPGRVSEQPFMERANRKPVIRRGFIEGGVNETRNSRAFRRGTYCFRTGRLCERRIQQDTRPRDAAKGPQEGYAWRVRLLAGTPDAGQRLQERSRSFGLCARSDDRSKHEWNERFKLDDHQVHDHQIQVVAKGASSSGSLVLVGTAALRR